MLLAGANAAAMVLAVGVAAVVLMATSGVRAALVAAALFLILPSALGEESLVRSLAAMALIALAIGTQPLEAHRGSRVPAFALLAAGAAMIVSGAAPFEFGGLYAGAALAYAWLTSRPSLSLNILRGLTLIVCGLTAAYLITWAVGFGAAATRLYYGDRILTLYAPFAVTGFGTPLWDGAPPRMLLFTGEPGLNAFFLVPAAAYALSLPFGRWKVVTLSLIAAAALVSQSAGVIVALGAGLSAAVFLGIARRGYVVTAIFLAGAGSAAVWNLANQLVSMRADRSVETVADRGLSLGGTSSAALGNINLISTLQRTPILGLGLVLALVLIGIVALRYPPTTFAWIAFVVTALFAQPSQWQVGAWFTLSVVMLIPVARDVQAVKIKRKRRESGLARGAAGRALQVTPRGR